MTPLYENPQKYIQESLEGKTVLDIGCAYGAVAKYCADNGARSVLGVDVVKRKEMDNLCKQRKNVSFKCLDIMSDRFLMIGDFDVVFCPGVLYHIANIPAFLDRLRVATKERLYMETAITSEYPEHENKPIMEFQGTNTNKGESTWWLPNKLCVTDMLLVAGFGDIKMLDIIGRRHKQVDRLVLTCKPVPRTGFKAVATTNFDLQ